MKFSFAPKPCAGCGKEFTPRSGRARYCGKACKLRARKPDKAAEDPAPRPPPPSRPPDLADVKHAKILGQIYGEYQETLTERVAALETRIEVIEYDHRKTLPKVAELELDDEANDE